MPPKHERFRATSAGHILRVAHVKSPQQKGKEFENYIVNLFNFKSGRFELLNPESPNAWIYGPAAGSLFPDLKFLVLVRKCGVVNANLPSNANGEPNSQTEKFDGLSQGRLIIIALIKSEIMFLFL